MKKTKSSKRTSAAKSRSAAKTVEKYFAGIPEPAHSTLTKVRTAILSAAPAEATEVISYGMPAVKYKGRPLVWFAAFSHHCSLFPTAAVIDEFKDELKDFAIAKGTIHFPIDQPLPATLVEKLVKARLVQNESKKRR